MLSLPCLILHGATESGTDMDIHLNVLVLTLQTLVYMVSEANDLKLVSFIQEKLSILVQKWFPELPLLYPEAGILSYMVSWGCGLICQLLFKALSWLCVPLPALLGGHRYFVSCLIRGILCAASLLLTDAVTSFLTSPLCLCFKLIEEEKRESEPVSVAGCSYCTLILAISVYVCFRIQVGFCRTAWSETF